VIPRVVLACGAVVAASLLVLSASGYAQDLHVVDHPQAEPSFNGLHPLRAQPQTGAREPTVWVGAWHLEHSFTPAVPARPAAAVYARAATTVSVTFPSDVPRPTDGLELQFMRVCTSTDRNLTTRIVHAPAVETASGATWQASFTIPEAAGEPRVWTMWAIYPSQDAAGPTQVILGAVPIIVVPAKLKMATLPSPSAMRPPDCSSP